MSTSTIRSSMNDRMNQLATRLSALEIQPILPTEKDDSHRDSESTQPSAIYRIPTELVCEIFSLTLPHIRHINQTPIEQPPWRLAHICQQWRAAALSNPLFWSNITLYSPPTGWRGQSCPPLMVKTQLLRSGTAPLHIILDSRASDLPDSCPSESIDLLIDQSHRWETVRLLLYNTVAPRLATRLRRMTGKFPMLRTLEIISRSNFGHIVGDIFSIAPSLRAVFLTDDNNVSSFLPKTQLPLSQLTHFRGAYYRSEDCLQIFQAVPNLVECSMSSGSPHYSNGRYILLPHLLRLSIGGDILASITAPSLQELWISGHGVLSLLVFIQRSGSLGELRKLVVDHYSVPVDLIPILQSLPTLRTFFVTFSHSTHSYERDLFNALHITEGSPIICPNLTHIAAGGPEDFAIDAFVHMVESRWHTVDPPPTLLFMRAFYTSRRRRRPQLTKAEQRIRRMRGEGLDTAVDAKLTPSRDNYLGINRP
ncbi:F-box domain-containing protein [Mycena sanguinolenta]|uniref:F-box domain-containing protein n=1 Tax=Mycena sanguinolenta TaxID=230812 RepID=A0A8H6XYH2_9AGAR|nr:F-box domain-containing protein [Mycena sanguinolenta]